jgi:hypothetical protein
MITGAEERALRKTTMGSDLHRFQVENEHFLANPRVIAHVQFPGEMNVDARFDDHAAADFSAEAPEQAALEPGREGQRRQKEKTFEQIPDRLDQSGATAIQTFGGVKQVVSYASHHGINNVRYRRPEASGLLRSKHTGSPPDDVHCAQFPAVRPQVFAGRFAKWSQANPRCFRIPSPLDFGKAPGNCTLASLSPAVYKPSPPAD